MGSVMLMVEVVLVALPGSWNCAQHSLRTFSSNPCSSSKVATSIRPILQRREQGHEELEIAAEPDLGILVPKSVCRVSLCRLRNKGLVQLSDQRLSGEVSLEFVGRRKCRDALLPTSEVPLAWRLGGQAFVRGAICRPFCARGGPQGTLCACT